MRTLRKKTRTRRQSAKRPGHERSRQADERKRKNPAGDELGVTGPEEDLKVVDAEEIGGGNGLDEAELGRADPLDGKPWDGDPDEPLAPVDPPEEEIPKRRRGPAAESETD